MAGLMLLEASAALDPALAGKNPAAMLSLTILKELQKEQRIYDPANYLTGELPPSSAIALSERLVVE